MSIENNHIDTFAIGVMSQQWMLRNLGAYDGPIDGMWGIECGVSRELLSENVTDSVHGPYVPFEELPAGFRWSIWNSLRCVTPMSVSPGDHVVTILSAVRSEAVTETQVEECHTSVDQFPTPESTIDENTNSNLTKTAVLLENPLND